MERQERAGAGGQALPPGDEPVVVIAGDKTEYIERLRQLRAGGPPTDAGGGRDDSRGSVPMAGVTTTCHRARALRSQSGQHVAGGNRTTEMRQRPRGSEQWLGWEEGAPCGDISPLSASEGLAAALRYGGFGSTAGFDGPWNAEIRGA